ncbi:MAG: hypothetical protein ACK5B9_03310 [Flavobacteriia bacterium]|jgi:hypothetical protein
MGLFKTLKNLFSKDIKHHNARNFVEILRTTDKDLACKTKSKLEKFKIPVYEIDHQKSNDSSSQKIILRIPEKYLSQANTILKD